MQPNISLRARHNHTTLKVEINQSRRRPTSQSLSKLPVSGLYLHLLSRGRTFPLASPKTDGPIIGKSREKVESSLYFFSSLLFPFLFSPLPTDLFDLKSSGVWGVLSCHVSSPYYLSWITLIHLSIYFGLLSNHVLPHVSYGSNLSFLFDLPCT